MGVELNNIRAEARDGIVYFMDLNRTTLFTIAVSTGLMQFGGRSVSTIIANTTLALTNIGKIITCTTDAVVITLPSSYASTNNTGMDYTIQNMASSGGALLVVKPTDTTAEYFYGCGLASGAGYFVLANTKTTQVKGDKVSVRSATNSGGTPLWYVTEMIGTWASAT